MTLTPTITEQDILDQVQKISCCSAALAYSLIYNQERGIENCSCSWQDLTYLIGSKGVLETYIPTGATVNAGVSSLIRLLILDTGAVAGAATLRVGSTTLYSESNSFTSTKDFLDDIIDNILSGWTASRRTSGNDFVFTITAPAGSTTNGEVVTLSFFSDTDKEDELYTGLMLGGQYVQTQAMNCLTNSQVQLIIENTTKLCGCSDCVQSSDAPPQPGAIIVNVNTSGWLTFNAIAGTVQTGQTVLIGKTIDAVFVDNSGNVIASQYSFDSATGIFTFTWALTGSEKITVAYS